MFTRLSIENFKAWRNTGEIRLAPITVFFGSNSAGKTSLLQFLLMLRQTAESRDRRQVLFPGDDNTEVDLGTYQDLVFRHDMQREISFSMSWKLPATFSFYDRVHRRHFSGSSMGFKATIASTDDGGQQFVRNMGYELRDQHDNTSLLLEMQRRERSDRTEYKLEANPDILVRNQGRAWPLPAPTKFYGLPEEVRAYHQNAGFTSDLVLAFEQQLRRIHYLGPLRQRAKRHYTWTGGAPDGVGFDGRDAIAAILAATDRQISPGFKMKSRPFPQVLAKWLKTFGLLDDISAKALAKASKQYEIVVEASSSGVRTNLPDVGFGVSQVLPVVVESFYADRDSTIVIEQPELHLHPRVQAYLANLFTEAIQSREEGEDRRVQFLIESHSEHFVYRLQRLIAEGSLAPKDVALYFCGSGANGSTIEPLEVDEDGDIINWPPNFFGDEMEDVRARLAAAAARVVANGTVK